MFLKLLKHEFKSVSKWYLSLYLVTFVLSLVVGFGIQGIGGIFSDTGSNPKLSNLKLITYTILIMLLTILIFSILFSTYLLIIRRFNGQIFSREGYLTLTLPVSTHQIILSKFVAAFSWSILSTLAVLLAVTLLSLPALLAYPLSMAELFNTLSDIILDGWFWIFVSESLLDYAYIILLTYMAISVGHLFNNHKKTMAIIAFFGFQLVLGFIHSTIFLTIFGNQGQSIYSLIISESGIPTFYTVWDDLYTIVIATGIYFITYYIIKNKVNLE